MRRLCSVLVLSWWAAGCAPATSDSVSNPSSGSPEAGSGVIAAHGAARTSGPASGAAGARDTGPLTEVEVPPRATAGSAAAMAGVGGAGAGAAGASGALASAGAPAAQSDGSLFPLKTGNSWTFRTTKGTEIGEKTQTVGVMQQVGGSGPMSTTMAYLMLTTKNDGSDKTESWQAELEGKIVRYRELSYGSDGQVELEEHWEPYKLRLDGTQLTMGATYTERYNETKIMTGAAPATAMSMDTWRVVAVDEMVTVPAGSFSAVVIEKVGGTSTKRYWFARGVGKVKEQSGAQLEELSSYMVMP